MWRHHRPRDGISARLANVRFGSKADMCGAKRNLRFTPKSGHVSALGDIRFVPIADKVPEADCDLGEPTSVPMSAFTRNDLQPGVARFLAGAGMAVGFGPNPYSITTNFFRLMDELRFTLHTLVNGYRMFAYVRMTFLQRLSLWFSVVVKRHFLVDVQQQKHTRSSGVRLSV